MRYDDVGFVLFGVWLLGFISYGCCVVFWALICNLEVGKFRVDLFTFYFCHLVYISFVGFLLYRCG